MTTLHFTKTTTATPAQLLAALTRFARGRSELFPNSHGDELKVHAWGDDFADVTEGGGGTWERLWYDWSDPLMVTATTTDSNVWGGRSGHTYTFSSLPGGATQVDDVVVRDGKNLKGLFLAFVLATVGRRLLADAFEQSIAAIEAEKDELQLTTAA
jgi:hypothetical protein